MARPSATAALLLVVFSLLAVAHCRTLGADHDTEPESTSAVAVSDENGQSPNPALPGTSGTEEEEEEEEVIPAKQHHHGSEFLRLPSHRLHHRRRPCSLHRHLWWKRHHGVVYRDAPRRFRDHYSGHGERREAVSHLAVLPAEEEAREADEVKPVAEPDPDRSLPDSDGEVELVAGREPSFADGHDDERAAAVRSWKKEMLRRWFHFHHHHGMHHHRLHHVHYDDDEEEAAPEAMMNMKRFHFHHHDEEDEEKHMMRKRLRHADESEHDEDSDDEDEQVEEMVRRFRKAIMRRRFGLAHDRRFFHHLHLHHNHSHRDGEEAEKQQAGGEEENGVVAWIKGLMNRF